MVISLASEDAPNAALDLMLGKLGPLVFDMEALRRGVRPQELAGDAPLLESWQPRIGTNLYLEGFATGHPELLGENRLISTSEVFLLSEDGAWARTLSRWYKLGASAPGRSAFQSSRTT